MYIVANNNRVRGAESLFMKLKIYLIRKILPFVGT